MKTKKTEVITFRTDEETKKALEETATKRDWTVAQTVNNICKYHAKDANPGTICLKANELYEYVDKLREDKTIEAVEVSIFTCEGDDNVTRKYFVIDILKCGGLVLTSNDESLTEMSAEEIDNIK